MVLPDFLVDHPDGEIRFVGSRMSLELVARAFRDGYTAEMIVGLYPTLPLVTVYKAIVFCLENRDFVDKVIADSDRDEEAFHANHKPGLDMAELRRRMAARAGLKTGKFS